MDILDGIQKAIDDCRSRKPPDFKADVERGRAGVALLLAAYPGRLTELEGSKRRHGNDLVDEDGASIEVKTDFWNTGNFFMERFSDKEKRTLGGPWRSLAEGVDYFWYFMPALDLLFCFRTDELVASCDRVSASRGGRHCLVDIPNPKFTAQGYIIPRHKLLAMTPLWPRPWMHKDSHDVVHPIASLRR